MSITPLLLAGLLSVIEQVDPSGDAAMTMNQRLGRGVNMGNIFEAPSEGEWGLSMEERYFDLIKEAGFDSVRIPVRWSGHAGDAEPYQIDPAFMDRVEWAINQALRRELVVVVNFHHYEQLYAEPAAALPRFLAMWRQVAERFRGLPEDKVVFEILNEPNGALDAAKWNDVLAQALAVIRESNPDRIVMVGPVQWNNLSELPNLKLRDDPRLIVTFHYYAPFEFTHQGAPWVSEQSNEWLGTTWTGTDEQKQAVISDFEKVAAWAAEHHRPIYLGEFGAYGKADMDSRAAWTRFVREEAERHGFSWAYWEFGSGFGVYDSQANQWRQPLRDALLGQ